MASEERFSKIEWRLDATTKLLHAGMKMRVAMQKENQEARKENREAQREIRGEIHALIYSQMRGEAKLDRLIAALLQSRPNGQ